MAVGTQGRTTSQRQNTGFFAFGSVRMTPRWVRAGRRLAHVHAAIDVQGMAGDVAGFFGGEEGYGVGNVAVGSGAAEGHLGGHGGFLVGSEDGGHRGLNVARGDGVDGDVAAGEFAGEGLGEADEAGFGGGVVGLAGLASFADDGRDVDDAAPAGFEHGLHAGLGYEEGAGEVGGEDVVPVFALHAEGKGVAGDAGVVDEDIDAAEVGDDGAGAVLDGVFAGDIERVGAGASAGAAVGIGCAGEGVDFADDLGELVGAAGGEGDGDAELGETDGAGATDSLGCSGDEGDAPGETAHLLQLLGSRLRQRGESHTAVQRIKCILSEMPDQPLSRAQDEKKTENHTDVYAIHGADPEVLAYAMAKYSRSSLSMKESLAEISSQRAEQFLNTFYFQYGHRSIADLAHVPMAIERLSLLAAIALVDEQRWDGQERSTRYQNFQRSGWYTPQFAGADSDERRGAYTRAVEALFVAYDQVGKGMLEKLQRTVPRPESMKEEAYVRTLKARAFDVARYLLPLATNTSLGQITNARTLETQISRLLSSEFGEIRALGEKLRAAAASEAWDVSHDAARVLLEEAASCSIADAPGREGFHRRLGEALLHPVKTAPTLVKYAAANEYTLASRRELRAAAAEVMGGQAIESAPVVDLVEDPATLEIDLAASLLYPECHYSWRQIVRTVEALPAGRVEELIGLGAAHRGRHDELPRTFCAGGTFRFDILMDIGGFRDMHRHRRTIQLIQGYTDVHGYEEPTCPGQPSLAEAGLLESYTKAMDAALGAFRDFSSENADAAYLLPLGTRMRSLFRMDFAEALYIAELRSGVAGHFSYRRIAWEMYRAVAERHPGLAPLFRISDVNVPVDLLQR